MADSVSTEAVEAPIISADSSGVLQAIKDRAFLITFFFMSLMFIAGTAAGIHAKLIGSLEAYGAYREIPWGILISTYVFFVLTSTGLCLVSSIGHVFGVKSL